MRKVFYTVRDIEDMARRGQLRLELADHVVVTDYARERARDLGVELVRPPTMDDRRKTASAPTASPTPSSSPTPAPSSAVHRPSSDDEIVRRIKAAVIARVGPGVDEALLDRIIPTIVRRVRDGG